MACLSFRMSFAWFEWLGIILCPAPQVLQFLSNRSQLLRTHRRTSIGSPGQLIQIIANGVQLPANCYGCFCGAFLDLQSGKQRTDQSTGGKAAAPLLLLHVGVVFFAQHHVQLMQKYSPSSCCYAPGFQGYPLTSAFLYKNAMLAKTAVQPLCITTGPRKEFMKAAGYPYTISCKTTSSAAALKLFISPTQRIWSVALSCSSTPSFAAW